MGHIVLSHRISCPPWGGLTIAPAFLVLYPLANTCPKSYTIPINIRQSRKTHVQAPAERGVVTSEERRPGHLHYVFRIPLPHSALPGGFVLPCSSVRLIRYYRTADDAEEDFYAHF